MVNRYKITLIAFLTVSAVFFAVPSVTAHVVVEPKEVGVGKTLKFTVDVPSEQDSSTVALRLVLPYPMRIGVYMKPGWNIEVKNVPGGQPNEITEIIWSGGRIPTQMKDEFAFFTSAPPKETTLSWKAYQTYDDGTVVAWDRDPKSKQPTDEKGNPDFSKVGPYAETKVIDDLKGEPQVQKTDDKKARNAFFLGIAAVVLSTLALGMQIYRK